MAKKLTQQQRYDKALKTVTAEIKKRLRKRKSKSKLLRSHSSCENEEAVMNAAIEVAAQKLLDYWNALEAALIATQAYENCINS